MRNFCEAIRSEVVKDKQKGGKVERYQQIFKIFPLNSYPGVFGDADYESG